DGNVVSSTIDLDPLTTGQQLTFTDAKGTWTLTPATGNVLFTPVLNFNGTASINYTINDNDGATSNQASLTVVVNPVNDAPTAAPDLATTLEDVTLVVLPANGLLSNDSDIDRDTPLAVTDYTIAGIMGTQIIGNDVVIPGVGTINIAITGGYRFTPAPNFNGAVPVITYTVNDLKGPNGSATSTLTLTVTPVNDAPSFTKGADQTIAISSVATAQTVTAWATALSKGPADESAQLLDFIVTNNKNSLFTTQPAINANGNLTYTPAPNQYGKATVSVKIHDNGGIANGGIDESAIQTFIINIKPVGNADTDITPINTPTTTNVIANDGTSGVGTSVILGGTNPTNGTITINPDKSITYTPNNGYVGPDTYTYILETPDGVKSDPVTVSINVYDPKMTLAKDGTYFDFNGNGRVDAGDRINYTFSVKNTGTIALTNISITDANATTTGGPIATLAAGAVDNTTFTGFHTLTQAEIDNGGVFNIATATGKDPKNNSVTANSTDPTPLAPTDPSYPVTPPTPACPTCTVTPIVQTGAMTLAKEGTYNDFNT
ncbi:MAG: tandem-95 repeat protein, partial [Pedobacter sp.]